MHRHPRSNTPRRLVARAAVWAGLALASLSLGGCIIVAPHHHHGWFY